MMAEYIGRFKSYIVWADVGYGLVIHNHKNPCGKAPTEDYEVKNLRLVAPRTQFKRLCKLCSWKDRDDAYRQLSHYFEESREAMRGAMDK